MACTKTQMLNLIDYILQLVRESENLDEAYKSILELRIRLQTKAWAELEQELFNL